MRETLFTFYSTYRAGRLKQLDHARNPFRVLLFLSGRSPGTIRPLAKPFSRFILYRAGHLKKLDHSRNPFHISLIIGQVAQNNLIHLKTKQQNNKTKKKQNTKKNKTKKVGRLPNNLFLSFYISL
jgi:hypothetical protein